MATTLVQELIDSGIHFGHRTSRWNPKMKPYIHSKKNLIHLLDVRETVRGLLRAKVFLQRVVAGGKDVLFVGTKKQVREAIVQHAKRSKMPYVTERWLGGTLTNFRTIRSRLQRLEQLENIIKEIDIAHGTSQPSPYSKKAESAFRREHERIHANLSGIREMNRLPGAMVVVDVRREVNACKEARKLGIPTVALIDTDGDPDYADIPIPGNDDAMQAVDVILRNVADACIEGLKGRSPDKGADEEQGGGPGGRGGRGGAGGKRRRGTKAEQMMGDGDEKPAPAAAAPAETAPAETPAAAPAGDGSETPAS